MRIYLVLFATWSLIGLVCAVVVGSVIHYHDKNARRGSQRRAPSVFGGEL